MPITLANYKKTKATDGVVSTLAFFDIYKLPLSAEKIWQLAYKAQATLLEVESELNHLISAGIVFHKNNLFALSDWDETVYSNNQKEIDKRWRKIKKYYWLLSSVPFVKHMAVINSVAMGNADHESDIDFFVITNPNRIYFVRTWIILLFKLLGVYKDRTHTNERFCFGFYISSDMLSIKNLLLPGEDPYLSFWLGTIIPIIGEPEYDLFIKENKWIYSILPNFRSEQRKSFIKPLKPSRILKKVFSIIAYVPAIILEPILRWVHIRHTFKLPENLWATSSTIANEQMLKLHALDPRRDLRQKFHDILRAQS